MDDFERGYEAALHGWKVQRLVRFVEYVSSGAGSHLAAEATEVLEETGFASEDERRRNG